MNVTSLESLCIERQEETYSDDECEAIQEIAMVAWEQSDGLAPGETPDESEANRLVKDMSDAAKRVAPDDGERRVTLIAEGLSRTYAYQADKNVDEVADQFRFAVML